MSRKKKEEKMAAKVKHFVKAAKRQIKTFSGLYDGISEGELVVLFGATIQRSEQVRLAVARGEEFPTDPYVIGNPRLFDLVRGADNIDIVEEVPYLDSDDGDNIWGNLIVEVTAPIPAKSQGLPMSIMVYELEQFWLVPEGVSYRLSDEAITDERESVLSAPRY